MSSVGLAGGGPPLLEVTEVMFDPGDFNDDAWEWIEVRNNGLSPIDLDGAFADRIGDSAIPPSANPNVTSDLATNTVIPAGGIAILYNGNLAGTVSDYDDGSFRRAWQLDSSVPLVAVNFFPELNNGGASIGFWADHASYQLDLVDDGGGTGGQVVDSFANALFGIDFRSGFPAGNNSASIEWNGVDPIASGESWVPSVAGQRGAATSLPTAETGADLGNPGLPPGGVAPAHLLITEIMYNPGATEDDYEWVEVYNGGAPIDFSATGYVLDDDDGTPLAAANITSGQIGQGETAILYNGGDLSLADFQAAWDPGGASQLNLIGVNNWSSLSNLGDLVAVWDNLTAYAEDRAGDVADRAVTHVFYDDDGETWPMDNNRASIYLTSLDLDPTAGDSWLLSSDGDAIGSFASSGATIFHPGGDVGSPGVFLVGSQVDVDEDGDVDGRDFLLLQRTDPSLTAAWEAEFGTASQVPPAIGVVPEPLSLGLIAAACFVAAAACRQRR